MEKFKGQFYGSECFTENTHISLKFLQCFTATGSLTYILRAFRLLRPVLPVQDVVGTDLRIEYEKGILSGNRNEGQCQHTRRKCDGLPTLGIKKIDSLKTKRERERKGREREHPFLSFPSFALLSLC